MSKSAKKPESNIFGSLKAAEEQETKEQKRTEEKPVETKAEMREVKPAPAPKKETKKPAKSVKVKENVKEAKVEAEVAEAPVKEEPKPEPRKIPVYSNIKSLPETPVKPQEPTGSMAIPDFGVKTKERKTCQHTLTCTPTLERKINAYLKKHDIKFNDFVTRLIENLPDIPEEE